MGEGAHAAARQSRGHAQHGHDRPHPRRKGLYRRRGHRLDVPDDSCQRGKGLSISRRKFRRRLCVERPHLLCRQENSGAVLFLRACMPIITSLPTPGTKSMRPMPPAWWTWSRKSRWISTQQTQRPDIRHRGARRIIRTQAWPASGGGGGYGPTSARSRISARRKMACASATCSPDSPAAKAGLKAGDVLVQFGDKQIMNLYDFTDALRASKVGQTVRSHRDARRQGTERVGEAGAAPLSASPLRRKVFS